MPRLETTSEFQRKNSHIYIIKIDGDKGSSCLSNIKKGKFGCKDRRRRGQDNYLYNVKIGNFPEIDPFGNKCSVLVRSGLMAYHVFFLIFKNL